MLVCRRGLSKRIACPELAEGSSAALFLSFPTPIGNPVSFSSRTQEKAKTLDPRFPVLSFLRTLRQAQDRLRNPVSLFFTNRGKSQDTGSRITSGTSVEDDKKRQRHPLGPRTGANGFGSFCRNKRACLERKSKEPVLSVGLLRPESKGPRRARAKPRIKMAPPCKAGRLFPFLSS